MDKVVKTDAEWKKELSAEAYQVLRKKGTERPYHNKYADHHEPGVYVCAGCGNRLFSSREKFESGTGWPSFTAPILDENIETESDFGLGVNRTEVHCRKCGGHLGHVFPDGPGPGGLRYCMNSASLGFKKE